jgi:DNA-binding NarL/FixJ family response regulator
VNIFNAAGVTIVKVLLVDDHALFLEGLRNLLTAHDVQVVGSATDGLEALTKARALHPDIILMDIQMPRCDGLAATRLIRAEMPEIKIVMLTMSAEDHDLFEAIKSGASGYLLKRLKADEFFEALATLMEGGAPFSPGMAPKVLNEFARQATRPQTEVEKNEPVENVVAGELTARQLQILTLVAQGLTYHDVGDALGLSERTIKYHMAEIIERLHLQNRAQVIAFAARQGIGKE